MKKAGGIDWPHHIGYVGNHVNPSEVFPDTEPVIEMTSNHGVFETYDKQHAVPVPIRRPIQPGTSAQDVLAAGKRIGMVGSSDSHIGFSGYRTGMFGVVAPELTTSAILDAIRKRRTIAIRGGEPIFVDLRADGHFIGDEYRTNRPPRLQIKVKATRPVRRIEIIRSNLFVLSQEYSGEATERSLEFADREFPPAFYYVRVQQGDDGWAWTSPVWVDRTMRATAFPEGTATPWASALLMIALLPALLYRRRPA
ncbi:MAG: hypothetical protein M1541_22175 [Acidobacteria bacterium]|nr:hypothetical protein [Acidobacteriota bacterium]